MNAAERNSGEHLAIVRISQAYRWLGLVPGCAERAGSQESEPWRSLLPRSIASWPDGQRYGGKNGGEPDHTSKNGS